MAVRVVIADDDDLLRDALAYLIDAVDDLAVVGQAPDGASAVDIVAETAPDVVLMDIRMPGLDGIEATRRIKARPAAPRVLMLTVFGQEEFLYRALRNGADGFLPKRVRSEDLCQAIRIVADGHALIDPSLTRAVIDRYVAHHTDAVDLAATYRLTDREIDVLAELAAGRSNDEIARRLQISEHTVKTHLTSIFAKTGCVSRVQAVILAYDCGLATPTSRDDRTGRAATRPQSATSDSTQRWSAVHGQTS